MAKSKKKTTSFPKAEIEFLKRWKGIGDATARKLLEAFGDSQQIISAEAKELQLVMGEKTGLSLFRQIHGDNAPLGNKAASTMGRPSGYTTEIGESIAEDYAEGEGTVQEIMAKHGFSESSFYQWQEDFLEFYETIKNAKQIRRGRNYQMALKGKKKLLEGYEVIEQTTNTEPFTDENGRKQNKVKSVTIHKKHVQPNSTMIIFELANHPDGEYRHVQHIKYEGGEKLPPYDFSNLTDEELILFEKLSKKALRNGTSE